MRLPELLRTRVARRILGLFLLCAMLPVATVVLLAYRHVASALKHDAGERLRVASKSAGVLVMVRIDMLSNKLLNAAGAVPVNRAGVLTSVSAGSPRLPEEFQSVAIEYADGHLESLFGRLDHIPALSKAQVRHLDGGAPAVIPASIQGVFGLFVGVRHPGARGDFPRVWGRAALSQVVGGDSVESIAPLGSELCLLDATGAPLDCPNPAAAAALRLKNNGSGDETYWRNGNQNLLMGSSDIFLNHDFAAAKWSIGLSVPESAALAPLAAFRRTFVLGLALAALLVFTFSHIQLRRGMSPLAELESGTRRLSEGDFSTPVVVKSNDEFELLANSFNRMAGDLQQQFATLSVMHAIDRAALEGQSAQSIVEASLGGAVDLLGADQVSVAVSLSNLGAWEVFSIGASGAAARSQELLPSTAELEELAAAGPFFLAPAGTTARSYFGSLGSDASLTRVSFPIRFGGSPRGALVVAVKDAASFAAGDAALGRRLADQLTIALSNVSLVAELDALSFGALTALARTIDAASPWTAGHSERVSQLSAAIAEELGLADDDIDRLRRGGLLHDLGKLAIPAAILDKAGPLTAEERAIVQSHSEVGAKILAPITAFRELIPLVLSHHELLDGSGYPQHLKGEQISLQIRIMTVADVFDALVSERPYRAGMEISAALAILRDGEGSRFDPVAVRALEAVTQQELTPVKSVTAWADTGEHRLRLGKSGLLSEEKVEACS